MKMNRPNKGRRLSACVGAILCMLIFVSAGMVVGVTVPVRPKDLPKTDATLNFSYTGEVTGLTVETPDGRTLSGGPTDPGLICIYIGDAPEGEYKLTIEGSFKTFQVDISGSAIETTPPPTTKAPTPNETVAPIQSTEPPQTETGSVATPTPTMNPTPTPTAQKETTVAQAPSTSAKAPDPTTETTVPVEPLPIIVEETTEQTTVTTTEVTIPEVSVTAPTQNQIDEFIATHIPTPQILVETESYFSLMMIYAVIPLILGGILGGGSYMAFGFYSIYNRKKRRLKEEEEEIIQY